MDREEVKRLLTVIAGAYPTFKPDDKKAVVDTWSYMLSEYDYNIVQIALKTYITTSGSAFAPSISELIDLCHKPEEVSQLNEVEAWALVNKAIRNSGYHAQEEFDALPNLVQKCVGSPSQLHSWAFTDEKTIDSVIASQFMRVYKIEAKREIENKKMPQEMRNLIGGVNNGTDIKRIAKK